FALRLDVWQVPRQRFVHAPPRPIEVFTQRNIDCNFRTTRHGTIRYVASTGHQGAGAAPFFAHASKGFHPGCPSAPDIVDSHARNVHMTPSKLCNAKHEDGHTISHDVKTAERMEGLEKTCG